MSRPASHELPYLCQVIHRLALAVKGYVHSSTLQQGPYRSAWRGLGRSSLRRAGTTRGCRGLSCEKLLAQMLLLQRLPVAGGMGKDLTRREAPDAGAGAGREGLSAAGAEREALLSQMPAGCSASSRASSTAAPPAALRMTLSCMCACTRASEESGLCCSVWHEGLSSCWWLAWA